MRAPRNLVAAFVLLAFTASAQSPQPKPEVRLFHPSGPPASYEVATIKPIDAKATAGQSRLELGDSSLRSITSSRSIRRYIMKAYGAIDPAQVIGGPDWLDKEGYDIQGKIPDDRQAAYRTLKFTDRNDQDHAMQQSLLADRFHLKAHFETRILPVYELVPAKGGLKITPVPAPVDTKPGDPPPPPPPGDALPPGAVRTGFGENGQHLVDARAVQMQFLTRLVAGAMNENIGRPVVDHTAFSGYFDIPELSWALLSAADSTAPDTPEAPSLPAALQEKLGIRVVPGKAPVEALVIDHIDHPDPN